MLAHKVWAFSYFVERVTPNTSREEYIESTALFYVRIPSKFQGTEGVTRKAVK